MSKFDNRSLATCKKIPSKEEQLVMGQIGLRPSTRKKKNPVKGILSKNTQVPTLSIPLKLSRTFFFALRITPKMRSQSSKCSKGGPPLGTSASFMLKKLWDFPGGPVSKALCSQCRGPGFNPWSGNYIPHAATKSSHATTKVPACCH